MTDKTGFEFYPILHREKLYDLYAPHELDMGFAEVRAMLDWLDRRRAFHVDSEEGTLYSCELPGVTIEVDVRGNEVVVFRRTEA
ncbi:MAG TPA: hypothetical protein VIU29_07835 [Candidatus Deferrimicrobiaceae bacterium]